MKIVKNLFEEIRLYSSTNKVVNTIFAMSLLVIVLIQLGESLPPAFGLSVEAANFYLDVLLNIAIGYIVSTIFYVIVVYYPDRQKKASISAKTRIIFARLQTSLRTVISSVVESVGVEFSAEDSVSVRYLNIIEQQNLIDLMEQIETEDPVHGKRTLLEDFVRASNNIENLKAKLIPFIAYLDSEELEFYTYLEELFIFENVNDLYQFPPKTHLLAHEFSDIVKAYYDCQKIVRGQCDFYSWRP
ncbi:hypothetical protein ACVT98_09785 [Vibrio campbellii]